ncbi:adenylate/guanylate cyclase catalytic domain protein [Leptospira weilii serovar Ranarum str. ICFT]|uniref:Adenylate/guanylate cyclase catalytic domain protein n=1 Tax=Leptospira weilii serovar Ranarum str. ICFT TaxID=1218598 RepID=N1WEX5_9LEPT|nr:adenylate/guanylate cyclase domain-containing protein [Leptospira weilii]EMY77480.1 adenylate/guanylate cyclase catalytic domain protein [Leptospira weilii serovar Ranarum str. ICFT]
MEANQSRVKSEEILDLTDFLNQYPWTEEWAQFGKPIDTLWDFELDINIETLWPWLIDTSSFNKRLGIPEMKFVEKEGKLFGSSKNAGILMEWEEVPWEWEYCKGLNNARIYSKGLARYVRTRYLLEKLSESKTKLTVYFGWIPRGIAGKLILHFGMKQLYRDYQRSLAGLLEDIEKRMKNESMLLLNKTSKESSPIAESVKLQQIKTNLIREGIDEILLDRVIHYILFEEENELYRIRIKKLAMDWKVPLESLLILFLHGCRQGLFTLSWDVICPHCRGVRSELFNLGDVPSRDTCDACGIDFESTKLNTIEVTFHIHPSIREVQKRFFCAAEPATKTHIRFQRTVQPETEYITNLLLNEGVFRLRIAGEKKYNLLELQPSSPETIHWTVDQPGVELTAKPMPTVQIFNAEKSPRTFIIEERKEDAISLRPVELFNFQDFRDLFSEQAIASDLQLDIGIQTILFTDIVGSTRFYLAEGDSGAFKEVREHFVQAFRIIKEHKGAVVKTIGDAVMASFSSPLDSLLASIELQKVFQVTPENRIQIRISIHSGQCLAVNLNSNIDYFGITVNYASKLQGITEAGEIAFSEAVFRDGETINHLKNAGMKVEKVPFKLPWSSEEDPAYKLVFNASIN